MATGTAWYNLTKPASTENFNLAVWNANLDQIDEQMHQNETETFTGATELANGTVGNVPAPLIADKDKFLKGDGTWATPQGGGGGSTVIPNPTGTPTDTLDTVSINGTIYEIQGSGGGGSAVIDTLYTNATTTAPSVISLSASIFDYDAIVLRGHRTLSNMETYISDGLYLTKDLSIGKSITVGDDTQYAWYTITANDTLTQFASNIVVESVYGIKFGSVDVTSLDFTQLSAQQISDLQTALGIGGE